MNVVRGASLGAGLPKAPKPCSWQCDVAEGFWIQGFRDIKVSGFRTLSPKP